jgi:hypothetical protein
MAGVTDTSVTPPGTSKLIEINSNNYSNTAAGRSRGSPYDSR